MASAVKSSRRSLPALLMSSSSSQQQLLPKKKLSVPSGPPTFADAMTHDLDLYYIRQIASHMKVFTHRAKTKEKWVRLLFYEQEEARSAFTLFAVQLLRVPAHGTGGGEEKATAKTLGGILLLLQSLHFFLYTFFPSYNFF